MRAGVVDPTPPFWLDVTTTDPTRSLAFYTSLFDWSLTPTDDPREPGYGTLGRPGRPSLAGIDPVPVDGPPVEWAVFFQVPALHTAGDHVRASGGRVERPHLDFLGWGSMMMVRDPWGASLCLIETTTWTGITPAAEGAQQAAGDPTGCLLAAPAPAEAEWWYADTLDVRIRTPALGHQSRWFPVFAAADGEDRGVEVGGDPGHRLVTDPLGAQFVVETALPSGADR